MAGEAGNARYEDGEWHVELGERAASHRLLRLALARAVGAAPSSVAGLAAKILDEARRQVSPDA